MQLQGLDSAVVLLDALGIKGIWKRKDPSTVLRSWKDLKKAFDNRCRYLTWTLDENRRDKISFMAFSDTIIIFLPIKKRSLDQLSELNPASFTIRIMGELLTPLFRISIKLGFYLRGCISVGRVYRGEGIIIGPAIDEAAQYYRLPEWIGVSTAPSASLILADTKIENLLDFFIRYDIPLKNRIETKGWALNWPKYLSSETEKEYEVPTILHKELRENRGIEEYFKIKNTIHFYDFVNSLKETSYSSE